MADIDFSTFPWTHPNIFTNMMLGTSSSATILACRVVCQDWRNWFNKNQIWGKYFKIRKRQIIEKLKKSQSDQFLVDVSIYRIERLIEELEKEEEVPEENYLKISIQIEKCVRQLEIGLVPIFPQSTYRYVTELLELGSPAGTGIKSVGPVSLFIKIKVDDPLVVRVASEILNKYLTSIIVDKSARDNQAMQIFVMRAMATGQNWVFRYFNPALESQQEAEVYCSEAEARRASALKGTLQIQASTTLTSNPSTTSSSIVSTTSYLFSNHIPEKNKDVSLKRKLEEEEGDSKKQKLEEEDEEEEDSIYSCIRVQSNPHFPTILELLDIDHPVILKALVDRFKIDRLLLVPNLEKFILHQEKYSGLIEKGFEIIGRSYGLARNQLLYWGGTDVRNRWEEFSKQLADMDQPTKSSEVKCRSKLNLPVACIGTSSSSSNSETSAESLVAILAARGISLTRN
ncbi:uncharacterized protein LOC111707352 isoform X2 [Eurytemora carolleeae]|uniref:uncharacterized protein LOC111707352 isoform X2 n=1 Tax=Eurytemora carolleeae TaxID=1294199 RepID=UPI000C791C3E|nr:uncharacterized protein LOC111707352 isoform X2 [Eurytemora carolleeae]|eukprot:XP_023336215.1 uncharacterized protein LOC111707352 isoform X2 [Eurytemora affinis]